MAVCFTIANINNTDFYEHNKAVMEKYEGYQFYHAYGSPVANVVSFIFPIDPPRKIVKEFRGDKITKSTYFTEHTSLPKSVEKLSSHMKRLIHNYSVI